MGKELGLVAVMLFADEVVAVSERCDVRGSSHTIEKEQQK